MASARWLDTTTNANTFAKLQNYTILIDGYEYTAIESGRVYNFETTSPSQIVQEGFDYPAHSVVQPMTIDYSIVVSKYDKTELMRLLELRESQKVFSLINPVHNIDNCVVTQIGIKDDHIDTLTLSITFQEINSSIVTKPDTDSEFQMFGSLSLGCSSNTPEESTILKVDEKGVVEYSKAVLQLKEDIENNMGQML